MTVTRVNWFCATASSRKRRRAAEGIEGISSPSASGAGAAQVSNRDAAVRRTPRRQCIAGEPVREAEQRIPAERRHDAQRASRDVGEPISRERGNGVDDDWSRAHRTRDGGARALEQSRRGSRRRRIGLVASRDRLANRHGRVVAERDVVRRRLVSVRLQERGKAVAPHVAVQLAPDRLELGREIGELADVRFEAAIEDRRVQQPRPARPAIEIGQDGEAREVNVAAAGNATCGRPPGGMCVALMSSPIARSTARRASTSPGLIGARTVRHSGGTHAIR